MASIDLLDQLQLNDYYPQKLSFREAIKLYGKSENGCPQPYGLEIVRKLLTFDSKAVVSVTTEINKHLNSTGNKETETGDHDSVRQSRKRNVGPSKTRG